LLDLYGPDFYPSELETADERIEWGKKRLEEVVDQEKFRLFFAVHEFEAWLLSQPSILPREVEKALPKIVQPERVDFDEPPAKLLDRFYKKQKKKSYKKTAYGKQLFAKLDPDVAVAKCPYLRMMLEELLVLATEGDA
jgi:hypothetical protein